VQRSEAEKNLSAAEAPALSRCDPDSLDGGARDQSGTLISPVKYAGDKTFILARAPGSTRPRRRQDGAAAGRLWLRRLLCPGRCPADGASTWPWASTSSSCSTARYEVREATPHPERAGVTTQGSDFIQAVIQIVVDLSEASPAAAGAMTLNTETLPRQCAWGSVSFLTKRHRFV